VLIPLHRPIWETVSRPHFAEDSEVGVDDAWTAICVAVSAEPGILPPRVQRGPRSLGRTLHTTALKLLPACKEIYIRSGPQSCGPARSLLTRRRFAGGRASVRRSAASALAARQRQQPNRVVINQANEGGTTDPWRSRVPAAIHVMQRSIAARCEQQPANGPLESVGGRPQPCLAPRHVLTTLPYRLMRKVDVWRRSKRRQTSLPPDLRLWNCRLSASGASCSCPAHPLDRFTLVPALPASMPRRVEWCGRSLPASHRTRPCRELTASPCGNEHQTGDMTFPGAVSNPCRRCLSAGG
jgi:hypothetical protein